MMIFPKVKDKGGARDLLGPAGLQLSEAVGVNHRGYCNRSDDAYRDTGNDLFDEREHF